MDPSFLLNYIIGSNSKCIPSLSSFSFLFEKISMFPIFPQIQNGSLLSLLSISKKIAIFPIYFPSIIFLDLVQNGSFLSPQLYYWIKFKIDFFSFFPSLFYLKKILIFLIYFSSIIILDLIQNGSLLSLLS